MAEPQRADFCIEIDFQKGSENPSRVFRAMTELIEAFQALDSDLVKSIHPEIEPVALIEDVEVGSLKAWLAYALRSADDDAIKSLDWKKAVGAYLVKAKYVVLDFIEHRTEITSRDEVAELEKRLLDMAQQTDVMHIPSYAPVDRQKLLPDLTKIHQSLAPLNENDKAIYIAPPIGEIQINSVFNIVPDTIEQLLTRETIISKSQMILAVKRPDYLGQSQWDFRHGTHPISAKILDSDWLHNFQIRQVDVRPGDSLRVELETTIKYGFDNEPVSTQYNILTVMEVLPAQPEIQYALPPSEKS